MRLLGKLWKFPPVCAQCQKRFHYERQNNHEQTYAQNHQPERKESDKEEPEEEGKDDEKAQI